MPTVGQEVRTGILLDTETTGLDHAKDEIIELGMVKFDYTPEGRIVGVRDTFSAFNEPSAPITAEVTALTGITNEAVAGQKFDDAAVTAFAESGVITIAHNSSFDRRFVERYWPVFEQKAWACSMIPAVTYRGNLRTNATAAPRSSDEAPSSPQRPAVNQIGIGAPGG